MSDVEIEEQLEMAREFTEGLIDVLGVEASVAGDIEDDRIAIRIEGDDLGLLIGQGGATMEAVREVIKTALQRRTSGHNARMSLDVGGYAARRREALAQFARTAAERALETGRDQVLEPMNAPDRKVIHDAAGELEGITTTSEGEEPRRRVVIQPES